MAISKNIFLRHKILSQKYFTDLDAFYAHANSLLIKFYHFFKKMPLLHHLQLNGLLRWKLLVIYHRLCRLLNIYNCNSFLCVCYVNLLSIIDYLMRYSLSVFNQFIKLFGFLVYCFLSSKIFVFIFLIFGSLLCLI